MHLDGDGHLEAKKHTAVGLAPSRIVQDAQVRTEPGYCQDIQPSCSLGSNAFLGFLDLKPVGSLSSRI